MPRVRELSNGSVAEKRSNYVINGAFDLWQRGTSLGSGTGSRFLADRIGNDSFGTTYTSSRQTFSVGQTDVPGSPTYFHRTSFSSVAGAGNYCALFTRLEDVTRFASKTMTLSFWVKSSVAKNIAIEFGQDFGTGGSPSAGVNTIGVTTVPVTTSWQKRSVTVSFPSIAGKTLGTNSNASHAFLVVWLEAGSNFNSRTNSLGQSGHADVDFANIMLNDGSVDCDFVRAGIDLGGESVLCKRYYELIDYALVLGASSHFVTSGAYANRTQVGIGPLKYAPKRVNPAITLQSIGTISNSIVLFNSNLTAGYTLTHTYSSSEAVNFNIALDVGLGNQSANGICIQNIIVVANAEF